MDTYLKEESVTLTDKLETWRPVVGYEGRYEVSDEGRVRSLNYMRTGRTVVLSTAFKENRYGSLSLLKDGIQTSRALHSLVAEAFLGPRPLGQEVNHKDGKKHNNSLSNLEYTTSSANKKHAFAMGLNQGQKGDKSGRSKLKLDEVKAIRLLVESGLMFKDVAKMFNVSPSNVSAIMRGKSWSHI
jgi:hypothetical protein